MLGLFKSPKVLDEGASEWLFDGFAWALGSLGHEFLYQNSVLVLPNNQFFPDHSNDPDQMANQILQRLLQYSGMQQWPCVAVPVSCQADQPSAPQIRIEQTLLGNEAQIVIENGDAIEIPYDPAMLRQPDALIAALSQNLAALLCRAIPISPPGGEEFRGAATDLVAIMLGFGLFMSNNAFNIRRGCSSCAPPSVQMMGELTEEQMCYALAIFCELKQVDSRETLPLLKKSLRSVFKRARKEVRGLPDELSRLAAPSPQLES